MNNVHQKLADWREELLNNVIDQERKRDGLLLTVSGIEADIGMSHRYINDIDRAIAAITPTPIANTDEGWELEPAPIDEPETQTGEGVEIPEGFTKWDGAHTPLGPGLFLQVMYRDGEINGPYPSDEVFAYWEGDKCDDDVIAYRIAEAPAQPEPDEPDDASEFAESEFEAGGVVAQRPCTCHPDDAPPVCQHLYAASLCQASYEAGASLGALGSANFDDEASRAAAIELTADVEPVAASWIDEQTCEPIDPTLRAFQDDHIVEPEPTGGYAPVTNPEADALAKAHDWYDPKAVAERNRFNPWGGVAHLFGKPKVDA